MNRDALPPNLSDQSLPELVARTYDTSTLLERLYLECEYLYRTRPKFDVGKGVAKPHRAEVASDARFAYARQYARETEGRQRERHLVLANEYPSEENQYANGFVHRRVALYKERGLEVDVVAFGKRVTPDVYNYKGVNVLAGYYDELLGLLALRKYASINVHFMNSEMWEVLKRNLDDGVRLNLFVHGYEVRNWSRIPYEIAAPRNLDAQIERSLKIRDFWSELVADDSRVDNFVFVSKWWKDAVEDDLRLRFPEERTSVIHNVIDTQLFEYVPKDAEQRFNFLWVRNARAWNYGADLAAEILARFRESKWWSKMKVTIVGDGKYFQHFDQFKNEPNVEIIRRYVSQQEIAKLHKQHGVFLVPSRFDTQGVSRDEAMSSGLVPVTNPVAAVPEFVDFENAVLGQEAEIDAWAWELEKVLMDAERFKEMSANAADCVRKNRDAENTVAKEIELMVGSGIDE